MSASREKKSRQESLAGGYVDPRTKREKDEQAKDRRSNALYIAIAVIFVIVGIVVTVANSKVIERNADAVTIGNETYTAADVSYFYNTIYSSFVSKNSYYLSAYGLDTSKSLKEQDCPVTDGGTWYDYFRDQALESLKSYALLAQKAEAEGFDGSEEVEQSVQDTFADLDAAAASAGYTRAQYIKAVCGPLVNEKVFERNVRLDALAQAYSADHVNSLEYSDDEIQAAYDADPKSYPERRHRVHPLQLRLRATTQRTKKRPSFLSRPSRRPRPLSPATRRARRSTPSARIWKAPMRMSPMPRTALPTC